MHRNSPSNRRRRAITTLGVVAVTLAQLLGSAPPVAAGTFIAGSCASSSTLIPFMEAANDESLNPGGDTIHLKAGCTYIVSDTYASSVFALPPVESDIIIAGHGARLELADGAAARSFFNVKAGASLILADITLAEAVGQNSTAASVHNLGSTTLSNVRLTHSIPLGQGGAGLVNGPSGVLAVISSTIENQSCGLCAASAIHNFGDLTVSGSTIDGNTVSAAIRNEDTAAAAIHGSTFSDNSRAISNEGAVEVFGSAFIHNQASSDGGAIQNRTASDLYVEGSYFEDNSVNTGGGAIHNGDEAIARIVNSTFYENTAGNPFFPCCVGGSGGAIENHHLLDVDHVTFHRNGAATGGSIASPEGAVVVYASAFGSVRSGSHCSGTVVDNGANVVSGLGSGCPATFTVGDPQLRSPAVNGSGTKTLALGAGSAAFDAVGTTGCAAFDQRGVARPVGAGCDAGAFEDQRPGVPGVPAVLAGTTPGDGSFVLTWTAASDPDGTAPGYVLYRRDADDAHDTQIATTVSASHLLSTEPEGTLLYRVAAHDGNLQSAKSGDSAPIVVDRTPPTAPGGSADRSPEGGDWFRDTVTVTFSGSTDPVLPDGSPGSGVAFITAPITVAISGVHELSGVARDAAGNESAATTATVRVDADDPTVGFAGCPRDVALNSASAASWSASDPSSGIAGETSGSVSLDTSSLGSRTATVTVSDLVGHQATATCAYRVIYDFQGFFAPLANPPKVVEARAGDTIAVAFGLGGDQGLGVLAAGSPESAPVDCATLSPLSSAVPTIAARSLDFVKAQGGRYRYQWVTPRAWRGTCRELRVTLVDDTTHLAIVRFR
ncbi:MAG TPA: PxKF domain-containing protein [Candidatus Limnocylindrales bacterium]|nr:PxKF domain-containing protein [Candidatus Limnocylindrales bacterium]